MEENSKEFSNELHQPEISINYATEGRTLEDKILELEEEIMTIKRLMLQKIQEKITYFTESKQQESIVPQSENCEEKLLEHELNHGMNTWFGQVLHENIFQHLPIYEQEEDIKAARYLDKHEALRRYSHETCLECASEEAVDETEEILKTSIIGDIPNQDESEAKGSELGFKVGKGIWIPREKVSTEISSTEEIQTSSEMETCEDEGPGVERNSNSALTTLTEEIGYVDYGNLELESVADCLQTKEIDSSSAADENPQHEKLYAYKEKAVIDDVETDFLQNSGKPPVDAESTFDSDIESDTSLHGDNVLMQTPEKLFMKEAGKTSAEFETSCILHNSTSDMHESGCIRKILSNNKKEECEVYHQPNASNFGMLQESLNESMSDVGSVMEDKACKGYPVTADDTKLSANFEGPVAPTVLFEQKFDRDQCISDLNRKNGDRRDPESKGMQKHSDYYLQGQKRNSEDLLLNNNATMPDFDHVSHEVNEIENVTFKNQLEQTARDSTIGSDAIDDSGSEWMSKHTANKIESEVLEQLEIEPMNDKMNLKENDVGADEGSTFGGDHDELNSGSETLPSTRNQTMENCESRFESLDSNCNLTESNKSSLEKNQEGTKHISSEDRMENKNETFAGNFSDEVSATYKASDGEQTSFNMSTSCALCNPLVDNTYFEKVKNIAESDYSTKPMQNALPCTSSPVGEDMRQYVELDYVRKKMQEESGSHKMLLCDERQMNCISYNTSSHAKFDEEDCEGKDHSDNICKLCCMPLECEQECNRCKQNNIFKEDHIAMKEPFKMDNKIVTQSLGDIQNSKVVTCNPCGEDRGDFNLTRCCDGTPEMLLPSTGEIQVDTKNTPHKECVVFAEVPNSNYQLAKQSEDIVVEAVKEVQKNEEPCPREKSTSSMKVGHQLALETWESMQLGPNRTDEEEDIKQNVHTVSSLQQYSVDEAKPEQGSLKMAFSISKGGEGCQEEYEQCTDGLNKADLHVLEEKVHSDFSKFQNDITNTVSNKDYVHAFEYEESELTIMGSSPLDASPKAEQQIYWAIKQQDEDALHSHTHKSAELQLDKVFFHGNESKYESDDNRSIKVAMKDGNFARTVWLRTNYTTDGFQVGDENHIVKTSNNRKALGGCEIEIIDIYNEHTKVSVPQLEDDPLEDTLKDVNKDTFNTLLLLLICNFKTAGFFLYSVLVNRNGIYTTEYTSKEATSFQKPYIELRYLDDTVFLDIHGKFTCHLESCLLLQIGCRNKCFLHRPKIMDVSVKRCFLPFQKMHPFHSFTPHSHEMIIQADLTMIESGQFGSRASRYCLKPSTDIKTLLMGSFYNGAILNAIDIAQMLSTQTFEVDALIAKMLDDIVIAKLPMYSLAISTHGSLNHKFSISSLNDDYVDDCRNDVDKEQLVTPAIQDKFGVRNHVCCQGLPMLRTCFVLCNLCKDIKPLHVLHWTDHCEIYQIDSSSPIVHLEVQNRARQRITNKLGRSQSVHESIQTINVDNAELLTPGKTFYCRIALFRLLTNLIILTFNSCFGNYSS